MVLPFLVNPLMLGSSASYQISRSLRFRASNSAYLSRTLGVPTNGKKFTISAWLKRGSLGAAANVFFGVGKTTGTSDFLELYFNTTDNTFQYLESQSSVTTASYATTAVYRDPAAHMHVVVAVDTTAGSNPVQLWVNGVAQTLNANTAYGLSALTAMVSGYTVSWGATQYNGGFTNFFDGLISDAYFIDGQALTASSFGQTNSKTGAWDPVRYTGTYGTNGCHLDFHDNSAATAAAIGKDSSGNGNNFTPSGISITSGATNDSLTDTPTNYGSDAGNGGEVRGNYCILNPADNGGLTLAEASLKVTHNASALVRGTIGVTSGKWYWEYTILTHETNGPSYSGTGVASSYLPATTSSPRSSAVSWQMSVYDGNLFNNGNVTSPYGSVSTAGQVIGIALDMDNGKLYFSVDGTWCQTSNANTGTNPAFTGLTGPISPICSASATGGTGTGELNFGQTPFVHAAPTGFKALCTQNFSDPTIKKPNTYFDVALWTGGTNPRIITENFAPDMVWGKERTSTAAPWINDTSRGAGIALFPYTTSGESATGVSSFNTNGYQFNATGGNENGAGNTYVGWSWKKGSTPGFDIQLYTGNATNSTISHSLGAVPAMIITKRRDTTSNWAVYHQSLTSASYYTLLDTAAAQTLDSTYWNATAPTSSVFSLGTSTNTNASAGTYVAYLWAEVLGFSKFNTYTGTGTTDGPYLWCGFLPRYVLIKRISSTGKWVIIDNARQTYNILGSDLWANSTAVEGTDQYIDILSNGFKLRSTGTDVNASGFTYIFAAFADVPVKYSRAR